MIKRWAFILFIAFLPVANFSQNLKPVKWSFASEYKDGKEVELQFIVDITTHWKVYGQYIEDGGPIPTTFYFTPSDQYQLVGNFDNENGYLFGKIQEPEGTQFYDNIFEMNLKTFSNEAIFRQKIKILKNENFTVKGYLHFMCCDENMCLPPEEIEFEFKVSAKGG